MKRIDQDPFSNGTEHMMFEESCCNHCVKSSHLKKEGDTKYEDEYTRVICAIQRDIFTRMWCNEPINVRTIKICENFILHGVKCPYMKTEWPKHKKRVCKEQLSFDFKD